MLYVERRVSLVFRRDPSCLSVRLRVLVVREFIISGCNEGCFERSDPFYKLGFPVFVNRDDSNLGVRPRPLLSSDP
jgi:hypothetical protein